MDLDFSALYRIQASETSPGTPVNEQEESLEAIRNGIVAERRQEQDNLKLVYNTYQTNVKKASGLRNEILKGVREGESIYLLFLQAVKALSLVEDNELFYRQIEQDILELYGEALREKEPLEIKVKTTKERLEKLIQAEKNETKPDAKDRIQSAIRAHKRKMEELKAL